jgi:DNA-binding PadR family transcriptional regulator
MKTTPLLSDLELALLGLIREEPRSGYALRKVFATALLGRFSASPGAIYPALRRLELAMLIDTTGETRVRGRTNFRATPAGRKALRAALEAPPLDNESHERQLLRFAFMDLELEPAAIAEFLRGYGRSAARRAAELGARKGVSGRATAALAIEHEIELQSARARWAAKAARRISSR